MKKNYNFEKTARMLPLFMSVFVAGLFLSGNAIGQTLIKAINCGGEEYEAIDGTLYEADDESLILGTTGTYSDGSEIENTEDDILYQSTRVSTMDDPDFSYNIPVDFDEKTYIVTLKFAELFRGQPTKRMFDVSIEDELVIDNLDVSDSIKSADETREHGKFVALNDQVFEVTVYDGELNISFTNAFDDGAVDVPNINAFTVYKVESTSISSDKALNNSIFGQIYPNPTTNKVNIPYHLQVNSLVNLTIYNYFGQKVTTLVNEYQKAGDYSIQFDAQDRKGKQLENGIYFVRFETDNNVAKTQKLMLLK